MSCKSVVTGGTKILWVINTPSFNRKKATKKSCLQRAKKEGSIVRALWLQANRESLMRMQCGGRGCAAGCLCATPRNRACSVHQRRAPLSFSGQVRRWGHRLAGKIHNRWGLAASLPLRDLLLSIRQLKSLSQTISSVACSARRW